MHQVIFVSMPNCGSCRKLENALDYSGIEIPEHKIIDPSNEKDLEWFNDNFKEWINERNIVDKSYFGGNYYDNYN